MSTVEEKVDRLEKALEEFIRNVSVEFSKVYSTMAQIRIETREKMERSFEQWHKQMDDWQKSMDETRNFIDELGKKIEAMREEGQQERREWRMRWGEITNRLGTMVEDIVAPSIPRIIKEGFGLEVQFIPVNVKKRINGRQKEYDTIAIAEDYLFLNSTKSQFRSKDVDDFVKDILVFREFSPEYSDKKIIGILATLRVYESVLSYAEKMGFLVLAVGEEIMAVQNSSN